MGPEGVGNCELPENIRVIDSTKDDISLRYLPRIRAWVSDFDEGIHSGQGTSLLFGSFAGLIADFGISNSVGAIQGYVSGHNLEEMEKATASWCSVCILEFSMHLGVMYFGNVVFGSLLTS